MMAPSRAHVSPFALVVNAHAHSASSRASVDPRTRRPSTVVAVSASRARTVETTSTRGFTTNDDDDDDARAGIGASSGRAVTADAMDAMSARRASATATARERMVDEGDFSGRARRLRASAPPGAGFFDDSTTNAVERKGWNRARRNTRVTARDARASNETLRKINLTRARATRRAKRRSRAPDAPRRLYSPLVVSASMYGTPLPNVNGVHRPRTLGRLVKCRPRRMGFDPRAPFSLANHARKSPALSAPRFFSPTVFSFPFAYDARTWGSHPRRISFVAEVVVAGAEAETRAMKFVPPARGCEIFRPSGRPRDVAVDESQRAELRDASNGHRARPRARARDAREGETTSGTPTGGECGTIGENVGAPSHLATAKTPSASARESTRDVVVVVSHLARAVRSRVSTTTRGRRTRAGTRDVIDRVRADATRVNVPRDAPADPLRALKGWKSRARWTARASPSRTSSTRTGRRW